jgi:hypothetical protein
MPTSPKLERPCAPSVRRRLLTPSREQRRHPRVQVAVRCWLITDEHTVYLPLHDLSIGGLSVRAPVPFSPTTPLRVELELPSGSQVRARGEVVWVRRPATDAPESGPRMGARFTELLDGADELTKLTL